MMPAAILEACLSPGFTPVSLQQIAAADLQARYERKYLLPEAAVPGLLLLFAAAYDILEIGGDRCFDYRTEYYDTPAFNMYYDHHNGYERRMKVRQRCYEQSGLCFWEVKQRRGNGLTEKYRVPVAQIGREWWPELQRLTGNRIPIDTLEYKLSNYFRRITLCLKDRTERLTIDTGISVSAGHLAHTLPGMALIEIKQQRPGSYSTAVQLLRQAAIPEAAFSKYAIGAALLYPDLKHHNLKATLRKLKFDTHA